jgi:hypothetical protein
MALYGFSSAYMAMIMTDDVSIEASLGPTLLMYVFGDIYFQANIAASLRGLLSCHKRRAVEKL